MKVINSSPISAFGGLNFVLNYLNSLKIDELFDKTLPGLAPQTKYLWSDIIYSHLAIFFCGGNATEDLNLHIKPHLLDNPFVKVPSADRVLARYSELGQEVKTCKTKYGTALHKYCTNSTLENLMIEILKKLKVFDSKEITIDYDNTIVFNEKQDSVMTYKKNPGYQPGVCTINETYILYIENRGGNSDAKSFQADTLERLFKLLIHKETRKTDYFRADAASYQYDVVTLVESHVNRFYIGCRNDYVEKYYSQITDWQELDDGSGMEAGSIEIQPFVKSFKKDKKQPQTYRLVVKRKPREDKQLNIFTDGAYDYRSILTNDFEKSTAEVILFYNQRGNMEREFDIMKNDFGWNAMPFSTMEKNLVFMCFTAIFRNLYNGIIGYSSKKVSFLKPTHRIKAFVFRFVTLPAKWIWQGRQRKLRIYTSKDYRL